ncbi:hypothetical protein M0R45_005191 [Rubus argutus]|uniref:Uncharacterized protein n=1 Tax=Rubus argutus TaxID=59490 RepID=A0AAW1YM71_RUBAR
MERKGTSASQPPVANARKYEPSSGYLIRRALSSLRVGGSSTVVHEHHDYSNSIVNSRGKEREIHTSSLSNTNPNPMQPNSVFGSFMVGTASSTISSMPPHPGHGILGCSPPNPAMVSWAGRAVGNQARAKPPTSTNVEFLMGRFPKAPHVQQQRERDYQREKLALATQEAKGWPSVYTLFPPPPPQDFGGKGKFGDGGNDSNDPYYPLPAHFIIMDDFS